MNVVWDSCPLCGSNQIMKKRSDLSIETRAGRFRVPRVQYHQCGECGERFFDYEASKIIDEHCLQKVAARQK